MSAHDTFAEAVAAYALDALDPEEARRIKAHVETCDACQEKLAGYRQVSARLGLAIEPPK
jgi:anti-sigma factor RsiW